jgi:hypothetical protein
MERPEARASSLADYTALYPGILNPLIHVLVASYLFLNKPHLRHYIWYDIYIGVYRNVRKIDRLLA